MIIPLFFTESLEKSHLPTFEVEAVKYNFIPNVNIEKDCFFYPQWEGMEEAIKNNRTIIFSHDADEQGNLLSSLLYYSFIQKGAKEENMIRMPLTLNGIGYVSNFYSPEEINKLKDYYILERVFMLKNKTFGFKKIRGLRHLFYLSDKKHSVKNLNMNGTNTITEITREILGE